MTYQDLIRKLFACLPEPQSYKGKAEDDFDRLIWMQSLERMAGRFDEVGDLSGVSEEGLVEDSQGGVAGGTHGGDA